MTMTMTNDKDDDDNNHVKTSPSNVQCKGGGNELWKAILFYHFSWEPFDRTTTLACSQPPTFHNKLHYYFGSTLSLWEGNVFGMTFHEIYGTSCLHWKRRQTPCSVLLKLF